MDAYLEHSFIGVILKPVTVGSGLSLESTMMGLDYRPAGASMESEATNTVLTLGRSGTCVCGCQPGTLKPGVLTWH